MTISFDAAFARLMGNEGGYSNNPADPGGETMWGITARVARKHGYTGAMKDLPQEVAKQIAKTEYWDVLRADDLPFEIAFQVFDIQYNGGHAAQWLQQAVGVEVDGQIGPATLAAASAADPDKIVMLIDAARLKYLVQLAAWPSFGRGWVNRVADNLTYAALTKE